MPTPSRRPNKRRRSGSRPKPAAEKQYERARAVHSARNRHLADAGDAAGCRAAAETWEKLDRRGADGLYAAAYFRAVAVGVQAMAWLTKAVAAGYKAPAHVEKDADLDALRGRADFRPLLASLPEPKEVAPPPRQK